MTAFEAHRAKTSSQLLFTIHECPACGTRSDVSRHRPGQKLPCPGCGTDFFVQGRDDAVPVPRVVRGPLATPKRSRAGAKILAGIGIVAVLAVGVFWSRHARGHETATVGPLASTNSAPARRAAPAAAVLPSQSGVMPSQSGVIPGIYLIKNARSGLVLDVFKYGTGLDARLHLEPAAAAGPAGGPSPVAANRRWIFRPMGPETWEIVSFHSLKALEMENGEDAARLEQGRLTGSPTQLWRLERVGGAFKIVAQSNGKALAQIDDLPKAAHVGQRAPAEDSRQLWELESQGALPREMGLLFASSPAKPLPAVSAVEGGAPIDGRFVPVNFSEVANGDSREGLFRDARLVTESVHPLLTGWIRAGEAPFQLLPASGKNVVLLLGGQAETAKKYPARVEIPMGGVRLTKLHFLGGVASWGFPWGSPADDRYGCVIAKVLVVRKGGAEESLVLRNGIEFADYAMGAEVPGSARVDGLVANQRQVRTFSKTLASNEPVEKIVLQGYAGHATPVFLAITGEVAR